MIVTTGTPYVAVIPARGGSKGIPGKNIRDVAGRPLLGWTIEHVRRARKPIRLVVSTDDQTIAETALREGAEVPVLRPSELATDEAPTEPAVLHAVTTLPDHEELRHVILLQATSPVRDNSSIDNAIALYEESGADSLVSLVESPPWLWTGASGRIRPLYDIDHRPRRQDVAADQRTYRETGNIYITAIRRLEATENRLGGEICVYVMKPHEGIDIDDELDLAVAEAWLRRSETGLR